MRFFSLRCTLPWCVLSFLILQRSWLATAGAPSPSLSVTRSPSGQITLSWPEPGGSALLEQTRALGSAASWSLVPGVSTLLNGVRSTVVIADDTARFYRLRAASPPINRVIDTSPAHGSSGVAVTRETVLRFELPLAPGIVLDGTSLYAEFAGNRLLARPELSSDRSTATLFYLENLPAGARIRVTLAADELRDPSGVAVDGDGDGAPGGARVVEFDTFGATPLLGTAIIGHVFASEKNPDGSNRPLANVTITVDGAEESLRAVTDAAGAFRLDPAPAGRFFVHVDGRTAVGSQWPNGAYYPFVGKAWEASAGKTNNLAGGSGEIFLPLIPAGALTPVSASESTRITFSPAVLAAQPSLAGVQIEVPANSLYADNGARGGQVAMAPVAPDRLPEPLPPGLNFPIVITVQTDGGANFDRPVPVRFPNLPDPVTGVKLGPGAKTALWSFNHDTGLWEIQGSMTISPDGNFAISDPGVGIRQPGWHSPAPGTGGGGPRRGPSPGPDPDPRPDPPEECYDPCDIKSLNFTGCWDGYYERYMKTYAPTDPDELKAWNEDRAQKYAECGEKLDELMECREAAGGPCDGPRRASFDSSALGAGISVLSLARQLELTAPGSSFEAILARAAALTELEQSYDDARIPWPEAGDYYLVAPMQSPALTQRGRLNEQGNIESLILLPDQYYLAGYFNAERNELGLSIFRSASSGQITMIPAARLLAGPLTAFPDADGDGLADFAENVLGTETTKTDTDGDGVADGLEVRSGLNPLDGIVVQPGLLAAASTASDAVEVAVENGVAVVLELNRGLAFFDVRTPSKPILLSRASLPGAPVAITFRWPLVAVAQFGNAAQDFRGVTLVDVSDPSAPAVLWSQKLEISSLAGLALGYGRVYVSSSTSGLTVLSQADGLSLGSVSLTGHDLRIVGDRLDVLASDGRSTSTLTCARLRAAEVLPTRLGSVLVPGQPTSNTTPQRLFSQANEVFVGTGAGYRVLDVRDPQNPLLLPGAALTAGRIHDLAKDTGSSLLATTSFSGPTTLQVSFFDASDLSVNTNRVLLLETPGDPTSIELYAGHAYVADARGGLAVLNYRRPDTGIIAPAIEVLTYPTQLNPAQHEGGTPLRISVRAQDDVAVRDVEVYVDGSLYVTLGSHPFETDAPTPVWRRSKTEIQIRARATDTAGNAAWTPPITVKLIPDTTPPRVIATQPAPDFVQLEGSETSWNVRFSEPMNPATLTPANVVILAPGPDGLSGTADDAPVPGVEISAGADEASLGLRLPAKLGPGSHRVVIRGAVADSNNLPLGADFVWPFQVRAPIRWNVAGDGKWSAGANWSSGGLPAPVDFVVIDRPEGMFTVTYDLHNGSNPFEANLQSLVSRELFHLQGAPNQPQFISVAQGAEFSAPVTFANSAFLRGGPWRFAGGLRILPQRIIEFGGLPDLYGPPGVITLGSTGTSSLIEDGILRPLEGAVLHHAPGSALELRSTATGAGYGFIDAANQFTGPTTRFLNEALITKTGPGVFTIGVPTFQNRGALDVRTGKLVVQSPFGQTGAITHDGLLTVGPGAVVEFQRLANSPFTFGRLARVEGNGMLVMAARVEVLGPYEFAGDTEIQHSARFAGRVRSSGKWMSRLDVEFAGLGVELTGQVEFNGGNVRFDQATEAVLPDVRITRNTTLAGKRGATFGKPLTLDAGHLTLQTPVRFAAPVLIQKDLAAFDAAGSAEFLSAEPSVWEAGNVNLGGGPSRIAPGAVFEARGGGVFSARAFRNEGTFRKSTDATITLALLRPPAEVASFVNAGLFEVNGGALEANTEPGTFQNAGITRLSGGRLILRTGYDQPQGETILAGGVLAARQTIAIRGGHLRGFGAVACPALLIDSSATLDPGAPFGVFQIANQLGDQDFGAATLTFEAGGRLVLDLGGRTPGSEHDQIQAAGDARLNGAIEVRLANGFVPSLGDEFTVLTARTRRTTRFASETLPTLPGGMKFEVVYETAAVKLRVIPAP